MIVVSNTYSGDREISFLSRPFQEVSAAIESLSKEIAETLRKIKPDKANVNFGIDIGVDSGKLTDVLAKSSSTANLEITLEWWGQ